MEVQRAYRHLLRVVSKRVSPAAEDTAWRELISAEFRKPVTGDVPAKLQLAYDYAFLIDGVHEQKDLLASYNIGIDRQSRQREDVQKSAARAGLSIPQHWDEVKKSQADSSKQLSDRQS
ncbi:hypothetical protein WJX73_008756 [Symbiochloris irregularis]|uniref:Complex 1 LYR protein n=1 Tax=Symbiochloris irregularis TaxID=706552 RepID=A0AAW1NQZ5_9CHLO